MVTLPQRSVANRKRPRRPAYALLVVLGFATLVGVLSLSFANRTAPSIVRASNLVARTQARLLADSGVAYATRQLMTPPPGVATCGFWTGTPAGGLSLDGSPNTVAVSVTQKSLTRRVYEINSIATVVDSTGATRARQTVTAQVVLPPPDSWCISHCYLSDKTQSFPALTHFLGNIHVNGNIASLAWSQNTVAATGNILWPMLPLYGPPAQLQPASAPLPVPAFPITAFQPYTLDGQAYYGASTYPTRDLPKNSPLCEGGIVTATNPLGLLISTAGAAGNRTMKVLSDVNFIGTLIVDGDLVIDAQATITSLQDMPGIIVSRHLIVTKNTNLTLTGGMYVGGVIRQGPEDCKLSITGPVINGGSIGDALGSASLAIQLQSAPTAMPNLPGRADRQPHTVIHWYEN